MYFELSLAQIKLLTHPLSRLNPTLLPSPPKNNFLTSALPRHARRYEAKGDVLKIYFKYQRFKVITNILAYLRLLVDPRKLVVRSGIECGRRSFYLIKVGHEVLIKARCVIGMRI